MKDIKKTFKYGDKEYSLVYNLNVMEEIQEEYETVSKWGDLIDGSSNDGEPNAKAIIFGFTAMLNEGIEMDNEENGAHLEPLSLKQVGRMITEVGFAVTANALKETVVDSTKTEEEKNV